MSALNYKKTSANKSGGLFALVDERLSSACEAALTSYGFEVIRLPASERLSPPVASHTDMLIAKLRDRLILSHSYIEKHRDTVLRIREALPDMTVIESEDEPHSDYPNDRIFNSLTIGKYLFINPSPIAREIPRIAEELDLTVCQTKQGYPACVTLGVGDSLAISSDAGMIREIEKRGIDTLYIPESEKILLPPYRCGFIGGAAGVFGDTVYFIGNLASHPSADILESRLHKHGYKAVSLDPSAESLSDLGGILFLERNGKAAASSGINTSPATPKSE